MSDKEKHPITPELQYRWRALVKAHLDESANSDTSINEATDSLYEASRVRITKQQLFEFINGADLESLKSVKQSVTSRLPKNERAAETRTMKRSTKGSAWSGSYSFKRSMKETFGCIIGLILFFGTYFYFANREEDAPKVLVIAGLFVIGLAILATVLLLVALLLGRKGAIWVLIITVTVILGLVVQERDRGKNAGNPPMEKWTLNSRGTSWISATDEEKWALCKRLESVSRNGNNAQYFYDGLTEFYSSSTTRGEKIDDIVILLEAGSHALR